VAATAGTFLLSAVREENATEPLAVLFFGAVVVWLTILVTVITMRSFAEERRSGTLEMLLTVPVTEWEVVLGKYAGALSFLLLVAAPAAASIFLLVALSPGLVLADLYGRAFPARALILVLVAGWCTAVGLVVSLLTGNQIVAAIGCFAAVWLALLLGWLMSLLPFNVGGCADALATTNHIADFARGTVDTRPLVLYLSGTVWLLFAAERILEARRWR
jgi:ABC-2 type transport system permease protein